MPLPPLTTYGYQPHPTEIRKNCNAIITTHPHVPALRNREDPIHLDVTPNQFLLHDIDQEIRYITPGGKIVDKKEQ